MPSVWPLPSVLVQSKTDIETVVEREKRLLDNVREIRNEDPRIGGYKLWHSSPPSPAS